VRVERQVHGRWPIDRRYVFETRLGVEECWERLRPLVAPALFGDPRFHGDRERAAVWGQSKRDGFVLLRSIRYRNAFQTAAVGRLLPTPGGTRVEIALRLHPLARFFAALWLLIVPPVWLAFLVGLVARPDGFDLRALSIAAAFGAVFLAFFVVGRLLAAGEDRFLLAWLGRALDVTQVTQ
jgi:hypothetical protein